MSTGEVCLSDLCETLTHPRRPFISQVLGLALAQHDRVVTQALGAQRQDAALCESLMKQHVRYGRAAYMCFVFIGWGGDHVFRI